MSRRSRLLVVVAVLLMAIGYLMVSGFRDASAYYMTVDELVAVGEDRLDKPVRVMGKLVGDSIVYDLSQTLLTFDIVGEDGSTVTVRYQGLKPDNMNDQWEAIVEGRLTAPGRIEASKVMIKCPSRYEGAPSQ